MNIPAVQHHAGYPDVYLASKKEIGGDDNMPLQAILEPANC
ncbi:MAG: hypothetical protein ACLTER_16645 [Ruminococcus sp.]